MFYFRSFVKNKTRSWHAANLLGQPGNGRIAIARQRHHQIPDLRQFGGQSAQTAHGGQSLLRGISRVLGDSHPVVDHWATRTDIHGSDQDYGLIPYGLVLGLQQGKEVR